MIHRAFSSQISIYDLLGPDYEWKREWARYQQETLFLHMFAPTLLGLIDRAAFVHGRPAAKRANSLASAILGERGNRLLKSGEAMVRARVGQ
jgi:CelD/BcsL family acetyltransferase involved in cellulose biosynthesis